MEISFIGAGNLAWHLAPAFENAGHHINEVYSRQLKHSRQLVSNFYDARTHSELNFADSPSTLFVLAVPDRGARKRLLPAGIARKRHCCTYRRRATATVANAVDGYL